MTKPTMPDFKDLTEQHPASQHWFHTAAVIGALALASPTQAEVYGALGGAVSTLSVEDTGDDEGDATQFDLSGYAGTTFGNPAFAELDALFTRRSNESNIDENNGLRDGRQIGLRAGWSQQTLSYEGFALWYDYENGDNDEDEDDGRAEGYGFGLGLSYQATDDLSFGAQVGRLLAENGDSDTEQSDTLDDTTFLALQGRYVVAPEFSAALRVDYVDGTIADDDGDESIEGLVLNISASYAVTDQLNAFAFVQWDDWQQPGEDDDYQETSLGIGVSYAFGPVAARGTTRMELPNVPRWAANVAGHLE